jgi:hypothetical protein
VTFWRRVLPRAVFWGSCGAALAVPRPTLAAAKYTLAVGARAEGDYRTPGNQTFANTTEDHSWDAMFDASIRFGAGTRRLHLDVAYLPHLVFTDITGEPIRDLLHIAEVKADWSFRRGRLSLRERASYGNRSFSALGAATVDPVTGLLPVQAAPQNVSVRYVQSDSDLTSELQTSARTTLTLGVGYFLGGAADEASRVYVPLVRGPRGEAMFDYRMSRRDDFVTRVDGTFLTTSSGVTGDVHSAIIRGLETWRRQWSPRTETEFGGGAVLIPADGPHPAHGVPAAAASFHQSLPGAPRGARLDFVVTGAVDAYIDRLTGLVDERATSTLIAGWTLQPVSAHVTGGYSQSLDRTQPNAIRLVFGDAGLRFQLSKPFGLETGVRVFDQTAITTIPASTVVAAEGMRWVAFVALVFQSDPLTL